MIVYNITIKVAAAIEEDWIVWQQQEHIPQIMSSGLFTEYKMFRLLDQDDSEGSTFIVQFFAPDKTHYQRYIDEYAGMLRQRSFDKWGNQFIAFRTVMEIVN